MRELPSRPWLPKSAGKFRVRLFRGAQILWECVTPWEPSCYEYDRMLRVRAVDDPDFFTIECLL